MTNAARLQLARIVIMLVGFGLIRLRFDDHRIGTAWLSAWMVSFALTLLQ